eukprot:c5827_g1_i1.p1 GENE.c5827_g1_i1~~c5827_g1_i1.p1  ORF type:complete len:376 (-),score=124.36 c5827_g1_i1:535-1596(-)
MNIQEQSSGSAGAAPFQFNFAPPSNAVAVVGAEDKAQLGPVDKEKLTQDFLAKLPQSVQDRVKRLQTLQKENTELLRKRDEEIKQIVLRYEKLQEPQFAERKKVVLGDEPAADGIKGVPEFWLNALKNHPEMAETITDADEEALKFLQDVSTHTLADKNGFGLSFFFAENPFFTNEVLTKEYIMDENDDDLENVVGCDIKWKEGKNLTVKVVKKKKGKGAKAKVVKKEEPIDSFFRFFSPPNLAELAGEEDEDDIDVHALVEADYELGSIVRQIVLSAVDWFTGAATLDLLGDDDEDDDEDDEDDEDEEEDEDEDEESEEEEPLKKGGKGKGGAGAGKGGKQNPQQQEECKQQ